MNINLDKTLAYYNDRFGKEAKLIPNETEELRLRRIQSQIEELNLFSPNILDFGCGEGWLSNELKQYGKVTGVDISNKSIEAAKHKYTDIEFVCLDAQEEIELGKYDIVVSSEVIEHIGDQRSYIKNISTASREGSFLVITTPNGSFKKYYFSKGREKWRQPIEKWLAKSELVELLHPDFDIISVKTFGSAWIVRMQSYGLIRLLGNKYLKKILLFASLENAYLRLLESFGFGLYIQILAKKK